MILIPTSCNFFSGSPSLKNSKVKRAWPGAMGDRPGCKLSDVSGPGLGEAGRYKEAAGGEEKRRRGGEKRKKKRSRRR